MGEVAELADAAEEIPAHKLALNNGDLMFVKLMADYSSSGVWEKGGSMMELEDLPISKKLSDEIVRWTNWYENSQFYLGPEDRTRSFDLKGFNKQGANIAKKLAMELPGWQIVFRPER